jgi:hypothetical protein
MGLDLHDAGDLGDRVGIVRRLERPGHQAVLADRLLRELGVDAGRSEEQQPLDTDLVRAVHHVDLDAQVVRQELGRVRAVGHDAADPARGEHDHVGSNVAQVAERGVAVPKVDLGRAGPEQVAEAGLLQLAPDRGPGQSAVPGDVDPRVAGDRVGRTVNHGGSTGQG